MTAPALINQQTLRRLTDLIGGAAALGELAETYGREGVAMVRTLVDGAATGNLDAVAGAAHQLKSSAGLFGFEIMVATCIELETVARGGGATRSAELAEAVAGQFQASLAELDRVRASV